MRRLLRSKARAAFSPNFAKFLIRVRFFATATTLTEHDPHHEAASIATNSSNGLRPGSR